MAEPNQTDTEASLRALGAQADATDDPSNYSVSVEAESQPAAVKETESNPTAEAEGQSPAEAGKAKPESAETDPDKKETETAKEPPKDETAYAKAKREGRESKEREAEAWKKIEAEKAAIRTEKEALEKERQSPKSEYIPEDFETAAANAEREAKEAEGIDPEEAKKHATLATQFREKAFEMRKLQWRKNLFDAATELKLEALKDPNTPEGKEFNALLESAPEVLRNPYLIKGGKIAAQLFVAQREAKQATESASAFKVKLEAATKEIDELRKLTSTSKTGPAKAAAPPDPNGVMSESALRRMAMEADSEAA